MISVRISNCLMSRAATCKHAVLVTSLPSLCLALCIEAINTTVFILLVFIRDLAHDGDAQNASCYSFHASVQTKHP